jgi:polar amino acid transport system substrate-binding protein
MTSSSHSLRLLAGAFVAAALLWLGALQANADDLATIKQRGTLIVGVKADYPPFGFRAPSGQIEGIEPALAADVAKSLGVKLELVPVVAANRMQFLEQGKIDLMIATMTDTPERAKVIGIVHPDYYASGYNIMVPKSMNLQSWEALKGKPVCGIQGAYYNKEAAEKFGLQVVAFTGTAEALTALKQGRCVGLLYDDTSIEGILLEPEWNAFDMPLASQDPLPWGLAVRLGQPEWAAFMSKMVEKWAKDGTIQRLEKQYHIKPSDFAAEMHKKYSGQ